MTKKIKGKFSLSDDISITEGISDFGFKGIPPGGIGKLKPMKELK